MDSILEILENTKVNGDYHTHVSIVKPMGKFQINKNIMENFWEKYSTTIVDDEKCALGIAEKLQSFLPIQHGLLDRHIFRKPVSHFLLSVA